MRARARDPEHRREKYSSNSLFEKSSRLDKTVKDLAKDDNKMSRVVKLRSKPSGSGVGKSGHGGGKSGAGSNSKFGSTGGQHTQKKKRNKKHSGRNSRNHKSGSGSGSTRKRSHSRSNDRSKDVSRDKAPKDDASKKGETIVQSFSDLWVLGFAGEAISAVQGVGLDISLALNAASLKTPGRVSVCLPAWRLISSDAWVLNVAENGYSLTFEEGLPKTPFYGKNPPADAQARAILDKEALAIVEKGAATVVEHIPNEIVSGYFARPKKEEGKYRPIVNLKFLNKHLRKVKFSMTTVRDIMNSIQRDYYFVSIDLTDAYYSIKLHESAWPFVRFMWAGVIYEYHVLVFGLAPSPRVFTKMITAAVKFLKAVFLIWIAGYIDDFLIQAESSRISYLHAEITILVFHCLGYEVNFKKSSLVPSQTIEHLGFVFDSHLMTISVPDAKVVKVVGLALCFLEEGGLSVKQLQSLIGRLESLRPAVALAPLHYRGLQGLLKPFLQKQDSEELFLPLSQAARRDLLWWGKLSRETSTAPLRRESHSLQLSADAAGSGWGGHSSRGGFCQGVWTLKEMEWHINRKELVAAKLSIASMMKPGDSVLINLDSRTAAAFINRMGGTRSKSLCKEALELWDLVLANHGWVKANWLPRDQNQQADMLSKIAIDTWEVALSPEVAQMLWNRWFIPTMDMFASWRCHVVETYCSWYPDHQAVKRDAFCLETWPDMIYCFPPVPLISMVLERLVRDRVRRAILVVPKWPVSVWWSPLQSMLVDSLQLGFYKRVLSSPLGRKLPYLNPLIACLVTGNHIL